MLSVLMTSTMKSEPSGPSAFPAAFGMPVSAAATCALGRSADGRRAGVSETSAPGAVAARAASCGDTAPAAPATATPAMKLRRLTFGPFAFESVLRRPLRAIYFLLGRACLARRLQIAAVSLETYPRVVKLSRRPAVSSGFAASGTAVPSHPGGAAHGKPRLNRREPGVTGGAPGSTQCVQGVRRL